MSQSKHDALKIISEMKGNILKYLEDQRDIVIDALTAYNDGPIADSDVELRRMREVEAIRLRDRVSELKRHIAVIKQMYPDA